jgi:hypothetical protein
LIAETQDQNTSIVHSHKPTTSTTMSNTSKENADGDSWILLDQWEPDDKIFPENNELSRSDIPLSKKLKTLNQRLGPGTTINEIEGRTVQLYEDLEVFSDDDTNRNSTRSTRSRNSSYKKTSEYGRYNI